MRRTYYLITLVFALVFLNNIVSAQCKGFAKKICKLELIPYIHDGNYHAAILTEGEEAELYKTFYSGQDYRLAICGSDALPDIEFKVIDAYKNVLYDNTEHNKSRVWDFNLDASQQLKITVKVPNSNTESEYPASGCVAIMFGFLDEE
ncbi:MAG: hypothetical protein JXB24_11255 [Bacteroidales bacterium]|jgi:hypothetical protein|nr:hypothetical protein [Bacteroidales bacterium]